MTKAGEISISPRRGTRRFRRNARLTVADGVLTVTNREGNSRSAPLDDSALRPRVVAVRPDPKGKRFEMALLDSHGLAFVIAEPGDWDGVEKEELLEAAGLRTVLRNADDVPVLRPGGLTVFDSTWWKYSPVVGPIGFAVGMATGADVIPRWLGFPVLVLAFAYLMAALASGAFGTSRRGKGWAAEQAAMAGDFSGLDAEDEARRRRRESQPPEGDTR